MQFESSAKTYRLHHVAIFRGDAYWNVCASVGGKTRRNFVRTGR